MSSDLVPIQEQTLINFTNDQIDLIKRMFAKNANEDQLALFLYQAKRTGLDPLARQIHCVTRWNKNDNRYEVSIQTGIDGYRLIADRTGKCAGSDDYLFDEGLTQYQHIKSGRGKPTTATVTVHKIVSGLRVPFTATAEWSAYYPGEKQGFMWGKMPYLMLGKCAEALALRKAFPAELSGIYTNEEMEQAGFVVEIAPTVAEIKPALPAPEQKPALTPAKKNGNGEKRTDPMTEYWSTVKAYALTKEQGKEILAKAGNDPVAALAAIEGHSQPEPTE